MKLRHWVILLLLLLSIVWVACSNLRSNSQTKSGATVIANATPVAMFEKAKFYRVNTDKCDKTFELFDYDVTTHQQFTVPPYLFCKLDKPFTPVGEPQSGLIAQSGIRGVLVKLVRFVRIRWETDVPGFYQEAFVEETKAREGSELVEGQ